MMLLQRPISTLTDRSHNFVRGSVRSTGEGVLPRMLLASKSPRRRLLLEEAGLDYEVVESGVDDGQLVSGPVSPEQWVAALAYLKAAAASRQLSRESAGRVQSDTRSEVIVGADTIVVDERRTIGQPRDRADAERILRLLIDGEHDVLTGVALLDPGTGRRDLLVDRAHVSVGSISESALALYLDSGDWRGKAGAYNLTERLAAGWPITFEGDPGTIMGLPIAALVPRLRAFGRS